MRNNHKQKQTKMNSSEGAGSIYNKQHAGHLPDYGGNIVDPNAKGIKSKD
ncbi:hypothetical protein M3589_25870 [Heyndrickxia oleronia]|uniref:Acid-soluble spore protein N n=1 Tax=Heyndrickxia oleronia TaxID=38875 RepID=A0AAW6T1C8_9BACI|nr:hypothetical protein [Heyndrickxia oleronia]MCM3241083.1 hypothetical protein [Heyndrickxia oleronia]MDH5164338.1 hypothetical protein [Heyndrickxia oleronia]